MTGSQLTSIEETMPAQVLREPLNASIRKGRADAKNHSSAKNSASGDRIIVERNHNEVTQEIM